MKATNLAAILNEFIEVEGVSNRLDLSLVSPILMWVLKNMLLDL